MVGGVVLRVIMIQRWPVVYDGATLATMGWSLLRNGEFLVPYADGVGYYRHHPPSAPPTWPCGTPASGSPQG